MDNPNFWKLRNCLCEPIAEMYSAAELLSGAVDAILKGDLSLAESLIAAADMVELGKSCKTLRNVWYMSACNGILTGHEAKQP